MYTGKIDRSGGN